MIGQDTPNTKSIDHLACTCVHILCACTQFHARTQRVSEYIHEYVYFQFVYVFCVCVCWMCVLYVHCVCCCTRMRFRRCVTLNMCYVPHATCMRAYCSFFYSCYCLLQLFAFRFLCFDVLFVFLCRLPRLSFIFALTVPLILSLMEHITWKIRHVEISLFLPPSPGLMHPQLVHLFGRVFARCCVSSNKAQARERPFQILR